MPIYEYECGSCGERLEVIQRIQDLPLTECPECEGPLSRLVSAPAFQFKGTGWYVTDYAGKGSDGGENEKKEKKEAPADAGSGSSEAKTAPAKKAATGESG
ncbi:MAG: FmdB family zinc ribbon protein [Thermoanaerobaculia bacterium]|nr:FmdB family zinc ribbon protein [Thermoanaerobaculia bacterium]